MTSSDDSQSDPASNRPDLSLREQNPIHRPDAIQPYGCLIACTMSTWTVDAVSANSTDILARDPESLLGLPLDEILPGKTVHDLRNVLQSTMVSGGAERLVGAAIDASATLCDLTVHISGSSAIIEIVPRMAMDVTSSDPLILVKSMVGRMKRATSFERLLQLAASQIRAMTGFDRVMVFHFRDDHSGTIVAESLRSGMPAFLGLRFPASGITAEAGTLNRRPWLGLVPDVAYRPAPLITRVSDAPAFDLTLAVLRSVSPAQLDSMREMGSHASLTISLIAGERLWGLISCHHDSPRRISAGICAAAELFGQIFSLQLDAKEQAQDLTYALRAREAHDRLMAAVSPDDTMFDNLGGFAETLHQLIPCDGLCVLSERGYAFEGLTPPRAVVDALIERLSSQADDAPIVIDELAKLVPNHKTKIAGVLGMRVSQTKRDYMMFFRQQIAPPAGLGNDLHEAVEKRRAAPGMGGVQSKESWREIAIGIGLPWTKAEVSVAETLRVSLFELMRLQPKRAGAEREATQDPPAGLIAEIDHRMTNILALIRSVMRQMRPLAIGLDQFADDLERRLMSLSLAHDQLAASGWSQAPLRRLLQAQARACAGAGPFPRIRFDGEPVMLDGRASQAVALVFHEVITNAVKHGALSGSTGSASVTWRRTPAGDLEIRWREVGGPPVGTPERKGFGSVVIEQVIPFELSGSAALDYGSAGVCADFLVPAAHVGESQAEPDTSLVHTPKAQLASKTLLLLEDSLMVALDAQAMLGVSGVRVEVVGTIADADRLLTLQPFDLAVLDQIIASEANFRLADELSRRKIAFVFATGYGRSIITPKRFETVPVVTKPYETRAIEIALGAVTSG